MIYLHLKKDLKKIELFIWFVEDKNYELFDCNNCDEAMQLSRNCSNLYAKKDLFDKYRFQLMNSEIIYQCPASYFSDDLKQIYSCFARIKTKKELGISIDPEKVSLLELDCYNTIENVIAKVHEQKSKLESRAVKVK